MRYQQWTEIDVFETLLGQEIVDVSDKVIDLQEYARQKFDKDSE